MLDIAPSQPSKFRTKNWVESNDDLRGTYNAGRSINFKTLILKSSLCYYSDEYILVKKFIIITDDVAARRVVEREKEVILKNFAPFTNCINEINNTQVDDAQETDVETLMYNLMEYSDNCLKISGSL